MKNKSTLIIDAFLLFLITLISGFALSYVYEITKAPIAEQKELKKQKANQEVFADASSFEPDEDLLNIAAETELTALDPEYDGITIDEINKAVDSAGNVLGYNLIVTTNQSYDSSLTLVFGYSAEGEVKGVSYTSLTETAGLGMKAADAKFKDQFVDKKVSHFEVTKTGSVSEDQIDAISGATVTSKAVTNAINAGTDFINQYAADLGGGR